MPLKALPLITDVVDAVELNEGRALALEMKAENGDIFSVPISLAAARLVMLQMARWGELQRVLEAEFEGVQKTAH